MIFLKIKSAFYKSCEKGVKHMFHFESTGLIGEHRLYKADIWNAETDEHAFTVYVFAPFLACAIKEAFKTYNLKKGLYVRTAGGCSREEAVRVIENEPERIMFYHPETDGDYFPECFSDDDEEPAPERRKGKRRLRIVTEIEIV